ncbi:MAG: hypothetical protein Q8830_03345, partial [Candidatus Phytoplasma australasiaticum]|nr:hypothetical protein [Candidatus Phytoplasma australasiaticum]
SSFIVIMSRSIKKGFFADHNLLSIVMRQEKHVNHLWYCKYEAKPFFFKDYTSCEPFYVNARAMFDDDLFLCLNCWALMLLCS